MRASRDPHLPLDLAAPALVVEPDAQGCLALSQPGDPGPVPRGLGQWARGAWRGDPDGAAAIEAARPGARARAVTHADLMRMAEGVGQALLDTGLGAERPLMLFAAGGIETLALLLGAYLSGVPVALADPGLLDRRLDLDRLNRLVAAVGPGMLHLQDRDAAAAALAGLTLPRGMRLTAGASDFARLAATVPQPELVVATRDVHPDRIARILIDETAPDRAPRLLAFSHRALSLQAQGLARLWTFLARRPAPAFEVPAAWHLAEIGLCTVHLAMLVGACLRIGHPARPSRMGAGVLAALPDTWERWADAPDTGLRLAGTEVLLALGGTVGAEDADRLRRAALAARGDCPALLTLWGPPESGGAAFAVHWIGAADDTIGLPVPGFTARLIPSRLPGLYALDLAGAGLAAGEWAAGRVVPLPRDADGFVETAPALQPVHPSDLTRGLRRAGRFA